MESCIFCKFINGDVFCEKVFEDDKYLAFLDNHPLNPGHTLVIPKNHSRWVWDLDDSEVGSIFAFANKIANAQRKAFSTDWIVAEVIGMGVPHAHIHLIPRFLNDKHNGERLNPNKITKMTPDEFKTTSEKIRTEIKN